MGVHDVYAPAEQCGMVSAASLQGTQVSFTYKVIMGMRCKSIFPFGFPYDKDYITLGSRLGSPYSGKQPFGFHKALQDSSTLASGIWTPSHVSIALCTSSKSLPESHHVMRAV